MDPLSAIGLASNIIQFVNFGCELISGAQEVCKSISGQTAVNVDLQDIAKCLAKASNDLIAPQPDPSSQSSVSWRRPRRLSQTSCKKRSPDYNWYQDPDGGGEAFARL
jgi:hypothetical protein